MKKLREVLYDLYKHLDSSAAIIDVSLTVERIYVYVSDDEERLNLTDFTFSCVNKINNIKFGLENK